MRLLVVAAALLGLGAGSSAALAQSFTKKDVATLLRIATITEWVQAECETRHVEQLEGMLLLTARSVLRTADAEDVERFRASVRKHVGGFSGKAQACDSATGYLKSVQ